MLSSRRAAFVVNGAGVMCLHKSPSSPLRGPHGPDGSGEALTLCGEGSVDLAELDDSVRTPRFGPIHPPVNPLKPVGGFHKSSRHFMLAAHLDLRLMLNFGRH